MTKKKKGENKRVKSNDERRSNDNDDHDENPTEVQCTKHG